MNPFSRLLASGRVAITGGRIHESKGVGPIPDLVARVDELVPAEAQFALVRASAVCSPLHLLVAVQGAWQALAEGTAMARDLGGETARFLAAERQVGQALQKVGLKANTQEVALALILPGDDENKKEAKGVVQHQMQTDGTDEEEALSGLAWGEAGTREALAVSTLAGESMGNLLHKLGWEQNDELLAGRDFDHEGFGLAPEIMKKTLRSEWEKLVLARCALVPLFK